MDLNKILAELRSERDQMSEAIIALERLAGGGTRRRGRPPAWLAALKRSEPDAPKRRGRPPKVE